VLVELDRLLEDDAIFQRFKIGLAQRLISEVDRIVPLVEQAVHQAKLWVLEAVAVPAGEKLVSLFETHTCIIRRGSLPPTEEATSQVTSWLPRGRELNVSFCPSPAESLTGANSMRAKAGSVVASAFEQGRRDASVCSNGAATWAAAGIAERQGSAAGLAGAY